VGIAIITPLFILGGHFIDKLWGKIDSGEKDSKQYDKISNLRVQIHMPSLVPRPSATPVFDHLQYAQRGGEGLGNFIM